ncbi:MAG: SGNH/GDSL hydrolase family protein [Clostridia bacterium]|nr:SGNH/GDSL hydrolase family protein [Clostridia bacterium]
MQGSVWERSYRNCDFDAYFEPAKGFDPDIIICLISENISNDDFDAEVFIEQFHRLHKYLSGNNENTRIIVASNFFNNEQKTEAIRDYAKKYGAEFVYVSELIKDESNLASGYEHEGIKIHPGDKGMAIIAKRFIDALNICTER